MVSGANVNATEPFSNDYLYPCSSLCESLFGMLYVYPISVNNIAFFCDFKKPFYQILLPNNDRDSVGFLWFEDVKNLSVTSNKEMV